MRWPFDGSGLRTSASRAPAGCRSRGAPWWSIRSAARVGVAGGDGRGDRLVLVPQRLALRRLLQHRAHHAAQVAPVRRARCRRSAGCRRRRRSALWKAMSASIIAWMSLAARGAAAALDEPGVEHRAARRGQPGGERVERAAHLVDLGDPLGVERRDDAGRGRARRAPGRRSSAGAAPAAPAGATRPAARRCLPASSRAPGASEPSLMASSKAR